MHLVRVWGFLRGEGSCYVNYVLMWLNLHLVFVTAVTSHPLVLPASQDVVAVPANKASRQAAALLLGGSVDESLGKKGMEASCCVSAENGNRYSGAAC